MDLSGVAPPRTERVHVAARTRSSPSYAFFLSFCLSSQRTEQEKQREKRKNAITAQRARAASQSRQLQLSAGSGNRDDLSSHGTFCWQDRPHGLSNHLAFVCWRIRLPASQTGILMVHSACAVPCSNTVTAATVKMLVLTLQSHHGDRSSSLGVHGPQCL